MRPRTLSTLLARIELRQTRQAYLAAAGAPASLLASEAALLEDLKRQLAARKERVLRFFAAPVSPT